MVFRVKRRYAWTPFLPFFQDRRIVVRIGEAQLGGAQQPVLGALEVHRAGNTMVMWYPLVIQMVSKCYNGILMVY